MSDPRQVPEDARWRQYEVEKQQWLFKHQDATPAEYEAAMRAIARRCGV